MRRKRISIHAPPRGATLGRSFLRSGCRNFNSRPSARGDVVKVPICRASEISIHAPPRGATPPLPMHKQQLMNFNSRPSARGDSASRSPLWHHEFQFTPLREGRHKKSVAVRNGNKFQFTPLREGRLCGFPTTFALQISIHAPPRGATKITWQDWQNEPISIHAPPRGATRGVVLAAIGSIFQFTPLREGRLAPKAGLCIV